MRIMNKKTIQSTLLITVLTLIGTSCNSAHELMDPKPMAAIRNNPEKQTQEVINALTAAANQMRNSGKEVNFITSLNKLLNLKYANMLGVLPQFITNDLLYSFIDEWYGTKYRLGGTDKSGIDCSAFVQRLYERVFNVTLLRTAAQQFTLCQSIWNQDELKEGDLVFFHVRTKRISHVGIYLMNDYFVHSSTSHGVMISKLTDAYWRKYYAGGGRVPKSLIQEDAAKVN